MREAVLLMLGLAAIGPADAGVPQAGAPQSQSVSPQTAPPQNAPSAPVGTAKNKAVARRVFEEIVNRGRLELASELFTKDYVGHLGRKSLGLDEDLESLRGWRAAAPDLSMTVDQMVAEGSLVTVRWTARGTNTGKGHGLAATGKKCEVPGITIFRFVRGRIAEKWTACDQTDLLLQLGLMPEVPAPPPK